MSAKQTIRIATRASALAVWQSEHVRALLMAADPGLEVELVRITTEGDRILDRPLAKIGGKGLFIKELETALLEGHADFAVHSMKDVPAELPPQFAIVAVLEREDPRDALVSADGAPLAALPERSVVGTSSLRRQSQLLAQRPDLKIESLRGNVPTRLGRLEEGRFDAIVLASAGLKRLGLFDGRCHALAPTELLPAVGQGAIGVECRRDDAAMQALLAPLNSAETATRVSAERAMNACLGGSCEVPIAGHASIEAGRITVDGLIGAVDGSELVRDRAVGAADEAEAVGTALGEALLAAGGDRILAALADG
ncbi:MAG: hydroxymethylbilane synthase [Gammaproteobacteria bacterium]